MIVSGAFALAICLVFYLSYSFKNMMLKRKGIRTFMIGFGSKPMKTRIIEILMMTSSTSLGFSQFLSPVIGMHYGKDWFSVNFIVVGLGVILGVTGCCIFIVALIHMKDSWRVGTEDNQKTKLVTSGIFSITRNPAFCGFDLIYLSNLLLVPSKSTIILTFATIFMIHMQILIEEDFLRSAFGKEYQEYTKKVPRYLM